MAAMLALLLSSGLARPGKPAKGALQPHEHQYFGNGTNTRSGNATTHSWVDNHITMRKQGCAGPSVEYVARTWMEAISPISPADAAGMCVAAVGLEGGG